MVSGVQSARAVIVGVVIAATAATTVSAQVYYMYPGAPVVSDTDAAAGAAVGYADNLLRIVGFGRFNIAARSDLGIEIVGDVDNSNWRFGLGVDAKYAIIPTGRSLPFDLAAQVGFGFQTGQGVTNFDIPFGGVISRSLQMDSGRIIVPYGGLYLVVRHFSVDGGEDNTDLDFELRAGASFELFDPGDLFLTLHVGEDVAIFAGLNARL